MLQRCNAVPLQHGNGIQFGQRDTRGLPAWDAQTVDFHIDESSRRGAIDDFAGNRGSPGVRSFRCGHCDSHRRRLFDHGL